VQLGLSSASIVPAVPPPASTTARRPLNRSKRGWFGGDALGAGNPGALILRMLRWGCRWRARLPRSPLAGRRALPEAGGDVYPADAAAILLQHPPRGSDWHERYGSVCKRSCHAISVPEPQAASSPVANSPCSHRKPPAPFCRRTRRPCRSWCCKSRQGKGRRRRARAHPLRRTT
jgi:hypothetical protein